MSSTMTTSLSTSGLVLRQVLDGAHVPGGALLELEHATALVELQVHVSGGHGLDDGVAKHVIDDRVPRKGALRAAVLGLLAAILATVVFPRVDRRHRGSQKNDLWPHFFASIQISSFL